MSLDGFITIDSSVASSSSGLYVTGLPGVTIAQLDGLTKDEQADFEVFFANLYNTAQVNLKIDVQRALAQRFHIDKKQLSRETSTFLPTLGSDALAGVKLDLNLSKYSRINLLTAEVYAEYVPVDVSDVEIDWDNSSSFGFNTHSSAFGNNLFVVVGQANPGIATSPDGSTWTTRISPNDNTWKSVTYGNGRFVAVANSGVSARAMYSFNGINWAEATPSANYNWLVVKWIEELELFVAGASATGAGTTGVMTSSDGITWTARTTAGNYDWEDFAYGNGVLVAVSSSGPTMYSTDAITWTLVSDAGIGVETVTFGKGLFVSGGTTDAFIYSSDGITWTAGTLFGAVPFALPLFNNIIFTGEYFLAGFADFAAISSDGVSWYETDFVATGARARSVSYGNDTILFVSTNLATKGTASGVDDDVSVDVLVYDTDEDGDLLGTFSGEITQGKNVIQINSAFNVDDLFVAFRSSGYFRTSENKYFPTDTLSSDKLSCTFPCYFGQGSVTQVNGGGLNVKFNLTCSLEKFIEENINLFQYALWYRIGVDLMKERIVSDGVNRFVVLTPERAEELMKVFNEDYRAALDSATMNIRMNEDPICFICKRPIKAVTSLP